VLEIKDKVERDMTITQDTKLRGQVIGALRVLDCTFEHYGQITGKLIIEAGANVILHGQVKGDVINNGGNLNVYGMVLGRLFRERGDTYIDKDAYVKDY